MVYKDRKEVGIPEILVSKGVERAKENAIALTNEILSVLRETKHG